MESEEPAKMGTMVDTSQGRHNHVMELCEKWEIVDSEEVVWSAAKNGRVEAFKSMRDRVTPNLDEITICAAKCVHTEIVKLCKK